MSPDALLQLLPDLVLLIKRDGSVVAHLGGQSVPELRCGESSWEAAWSEATAALLRQLLRRSLAHRIPVEARFEEKGRHYDLRVTPQGPDRAIGVVRLVLPGARDESADAGGDRKRPQLDRRGFLRRLKESMSVATLREQPLAIAVLHVDGIADVAQFIAAEVSEQIMSAVLLRLASQESAQEQPKWYLGQVGETVLAMVMETADRDAVEACVARVCESLREPVTAADVEFRLTPYAGVAVLGLDASSPKMLLEHARAAAHEARRASSKDVFFHSDTMGLRSLARLDLARELREAIANGDFRCRYMGRHDLRTGRMVARVGYVRWQHPLRGEIRPAEFLRVAEATGLSVELSRAVLKSVCRDFAQLEPDVRVSFGALHDHFFHEEFAADVERTLAEYSLPAERLELRVAEKALALRDLSSFRSLQKRSVQIVVDEVGRGMTSLAALARAPVWGLQLDRAWVAALRSDDVARKVCGAGINLATSLGLTPIAMGVDNDAQREALLEMGCLYGSGDLYSSSASDLSRSRRSAKRA
jgi:EAL domain-containing protein (putative c-di-GMP-specific phosphodiesterase class I)/GGDEF domain-containing protein